MTWGYDGRDPISGCSMQVLKLGSPAVPFCRFYLGVSLLKRNITKKGTLIINGLLGNLGKTFGRSRAVEELMLRSLGMDLWCAAGLLLKNLM